MKTLLLLVLHKCVKTLLLLVLHTMCEDPIVAGTVNSRHMCGGHIVAGTVNSEARRIDVCTE